MKSAASSELESVIHLSNMRFFLSKNEMFHNLCKGQLCPHFYVTRNSLQFKHHSQFSSCRAFGTFRNEWAQTCEKKKSRDIKLSVGNSISGRRHLSGVLICKHQTYYSKAIKINRASLEDTQKAVRSTYGIKGYQSIPRSLVEARRNSVNSAKPSWWTIRSQNMPSSIYYWGCQGKLSGTSSSRNGKTGNHNESLECRVETRSKRTFSWGTQQCKHCWCF